MSFKTKLYCSHSRVNLTVINQKNKNVRCEKKFVTFFLFIIKPNTESNRILYIEGPEHTLTVRASPHTTGQVHGLG